MTQTYPAQLRYDDSVVFATMIAICTLAAGQSYPQLLPSPLAFCEKTKAKVTCMESDGGGLPGFFIANNLRISCLQSCPSQWREARSRIPLHGGLYQYEVTATFDTSRAWDNVTLQCEVLSGKRIRSIVIVADEPSIKLSVTNLILWVGHRQTSKCQAEMNCNMSGYSSIQWVVNCSIPGGCIFEITHSDSKSLEISFDATTAWNGSSVHCSLENGGLWLSPSQTLIVYDVTVEVSLKNPVTWLGDQQSIICRVRGDYAGITGVHPARWNVTCPNGNCLYTVEQLPDGTSLIFNATWQWNGASTICVLAGAPSKTPTAQLNVTVYAFQPPLITPENTVTFFEDQTFCINCRAADGSAADDLTWSVRCALDVGAKTHAGVSVRRPCRYALHLGTDGFEAPASLFTFMAKRDEWNGATVTCTSIRSGLSASVTVSTRPLPPITVSTDAITTYIGMTATATCAAHKLWTVAELSWSVRNCGSGGRCSIKSDLPLSCGGRQVSFVASRDWNGAKLACSASTPYYQQSSEISVIVKAFPGIKLSSNGPNLTFSNGENVTLFCAASEHFTGGALLWTMRCSLGPCPASRQGSLSAAVGGRRFLAFQASNAWSGSTLHCSVAQFPSSVRSLRIDVIEAASSHPPALESDGSHFWLGISLCTAAAIALPLCAVSCGMLLCKKPRTGGSPKRLQETHVTSIGTSVGLTRPSALKKRRASALATTADVVAAATPVAAEFNIESFGSRPTSSVPPVWAGTTVERAPLKRKRISGHGAAMRCGAIKTNAAKNTRDFATCAKR